MGKAVVANYQDAGGKLEPAEGFKVNVGRGIEARVDGTDVRVEKFTERDFEDESLAALLKTANEQLAQGATVISVKLDKDVAGIIVLADTVRGVCRSHRPHPEARHHADAGHRRQRAGVGGHRQEDGNQIGRVGPSARRQDEPDPLRGRRQPQGLHGGRRRQRRAGSQLRVLGRRHGRHRQRHRRRVLGRRARERRHLAASYLLELCRKTLRKTKQNVGVSHVLNFTTIVLSDLGVLTPITGALWHNIGSVFVVVNAAMLLWQKDGRNRSDR